MVRWPSTAGLSTASGPRRPQVKQVNTTSKRFFVARPVRCSRMIAATAASLDALGVRQPVRPRADAGGATR